MKFNTQICDNPAQLETQALGLGIFSDTLTEMVELVNIYSNGFVRSVLDKGFSAAKSKILILYHVPGVKAERLIIVGLGKKSDYSLTAYADAEETFIRTCVDSNIKNIISGLLLNPIEKISIRDQAHISAISAGKATYKYDTTFSKKNLKQNQETIKITQLTNSSIDAETRTGLLEGHSIVMGMTLAKTLGNLPSNICTPLYLCETAQKLEKESKNIEVQVMDSKKIQELNMGAFLSVSKGSEKAPYLITLKYKHQACFQQKNTKKPIVLIGKGVTFDSGGISIKPAESMDEMKYDMCGAACVLGIFQALKELELPLESEIIGVIGTCENLPGANASKPGDVVTSMSGKTIEILNTDAEGRLLLCDILTYVKHFDPSIVIDIATLTGACVIALGHINSGMFSKDKDLVDDLSKAGKQIMDRVWNMPLDDEYHKQLESNFADIANIGGRTAGAVTAACFLSKFSGSYRWAHLDIAGTAWKSGEKKGATGRPVPLLLQFLINQAKKSGY